MENQNPAKANVSFEIESQSKNRKDIRNSQSSKATLSSWLNDEHIESFCEGFTVHALPMAFKVNTSPFRRFIWFILFLASFATSIVFIQNILAEFLEREAMTTSTIMAFDAKQGMKFPSITIWNESPVKASLLLDKNSNYSKYSEDLCSIRTEVHGGGVHGGPIPEDWNEALAKELGINMKDMLIDCEFNRIPCTHENFTRAFTPYPYYRWGIGYTFNHQSNLTTNGTGPTHGLKLVLNTQYSEYCPSTLSSGIRVQLHDHTDLEDTIALEHIDPSLGDTVEPGKYTSIIAKKKEIQSIGKPYSSDCIDLKNGDPYPSSNITRDCVYGCEDREFEEITPYNLLNTSNQCVIDCYGARSTQFCNAVEFETRKSIAKISSLNLEKVEELTSDMFEELYKDKSIFAPFLPSNLDDTSLSELQEILDKEIQKNIVVVDIYYDNLKYESTSEIPSLTVWRMLGDVGGILGLFLGASIITGIEFVEISILIILRCIEYCTNASSHRETYFKKYYMSKDERMHRSNNLDAVQSKTGNYTFSQPKIPEMI